VSIALGIFENFSKTSKKFFPLVEFLHRKRGNFVKLFDFYKKISFFVCEKKRAFARKREILRAFIF